MIEIDDRYRGPLGMSNGGMAAGILTEGLEGPTEVRLERPVPFAERIELRGGGKDRELVLAGRRLATARPATAPAAPPSFVPPGAVLAEEPWRHDLAFYADCFVCGRPAPDGLGVELRRLGEGRFAAVWTPSGCDAIRPGPVPTRFLWAALDCPGGYAALVPAERIGLLGSLTVEVERRVDADETLVVVGEGTTVEGRKLGAATAVYTAVGDLVAAGSAVWIAVEAAA